MNYYVFESSSVVAKVKTSLTTEGVLWVCVPSDQEGTESVNQR